MPAENLVYAVAKIVLLVAVVRRRADCSGVFVAWTVPLLLLIVPVNAAAVPPAHPAPCERDPRARASGCPRGVSARYVAADYIAYADLGGHDRRCCR